MAEPTRSPFGELVHRHRRRLGMTQRQMANLSVADSERVFNGAPFSDRSVQAWTRQTLDPAKWTAPHHAALRTLATVLRIDEGSEEYHALDAAATEVRQAIEQASGASDASSRRGAPNEKSARLFVAAGREPHLARLRQMVNAAAGGAPGLALLSADPGTGKSSLLEDICQDASRRHAGLVTLWANCPRRMGFSESPSPFRQIVARMVGDLEAASDQELVSPANEARLIARIPAAVRAIEAGMRRADGPIPHHRVPAQPQPGCHRRP